MKRKSNFELLEERRLKNRLKKKEAYDSVYNLSVEKNDEKKYLATAEMTNKNTKVRLLDEGMIVDANGNPYLYIAKGAVKKWYENLSNDFVGEINIAHSNKNEDPFRYGTWTKEDLSLVDIGNGRYGVDVEVKLDTRLSVVQDLMKLDYPLAISSEFYGKVNKVLSNEVKAEFLDDIEINEFAIVRSPGNVRSNGLKLSTRGDEEMKENLFDKFKKYWMNAEETEEEVEQEQEEEVEEEAKEEEQQEEEISDEQLIEEIKEQLSAAEETTKALDEATKSLEEANEVLEKLSAVIDQKDKEIAELKELVAEKEKHNMSTNENVVKDAANKIERIRLAMCAIKNDYKSEEEKEKLASKLADGKHTQQPILFDPAGKL